MKKLSNFIQKYEDYILNREKHYKSMTKINLKTLIFSIVIIALTYFIGLLFNSLYNIGYLLGMSNVIVLSTYLIYKILRTKQYNEAFEQKYSLDVSILMNILYVLVILMSASLFLLFTVYFGYVSFIVYLIFIFVFISSLTIYILVYERTIKIELPGIYRLLLNGFFIGLLFYGLIMLIHINNITLSFLVVGLSLPE